MTPATSVPNILLPAWRWFSARLWWMEHAFERARASGKVEDDARIAALGEELSGGIGEGLRIHRGGVHFHNIGSILRGMRIFGAL